MIDSQLARLGPTKRTAGRFRPQRARLVGCGAQLRRVEWPPRSTLTKSTRLGARTQTSDTNRRDQVGRKSGRSSRLELDGSIWRPRQPQTEAPDARAVDAQLSRKQILCSLRLNSLIEPPPPGAPPRLCRESCSSPPLLFGRPLVWLFGLLFGR